MKKLKISGTLKSDISLQHIQKHFTTRVGSSYYGDIYSDNLEIYNDGTFEGMLYLDEDVDNNEIVDVANEIIMENIDDTYYMIDNFTISI